MSITTRRLPAAVGAGLLVAAVAAVAATQVPPDDELESAIDPKAAVIRLLPPQSDSGGPTLIEALLIDPDVHNVLFYVDGVLVERRRFAPWEAKLKLTSPAQEQLLRVEAVNRDDEVLGTDEMLVNRRIKPLRVRIDALEPTAGGLLLEAEVSIPEQVELAGADIWWNETLVATYGSADIVDDAIVEEIERTTADPEDLVRVVARLEDGREIEDVALVSAPGFEEKVDVNLVQLQVVVTNRDGIPITGLTKEHFAIREKKQEIEPAGLFEADRVSLLLGFALDTSGSMQRIWNETQAAATSFLESTIRDRDEGFLVDFNTRLNLAQPRTADKRLLQQAFTELEPQGNTALYDAILFSILQFDRQQGRRGLVVVTDGFDVASQADPDRAVEFGKKLGVPIYILAMEGGDLRGSDADTAVQTLRLLTDPTGGRLFRVLSMDQLTRALKIINSEMRNQYVLTYYTDSPPEPGNPPEVRLQIPNRKDFIVKVVFGEDQIY